MFSWMLQNIMRSSSPWEVHACRKGISAHYSLHWSRIMESNTGAHNLHTLPFFSTQKWPLHASLSLMLVVWVKTGLQGDCSRCTSDLDTPGVGLILWEISWCPGGAPCMNLTSWEERGLGCRDIRRGLGVCLLLTDAFLVALCQLCRCCILIQKESWCGRLWHCRYICMEPHWEGSWRSFLHNTALVVLSHCCSPTHLLTTGHLKQPCHGHLCECVISLTIPNPSIVIHVNLNINWSISLLLYKRRLCSWFFCDGRSFACRLVVIDIL